MAALAGSVAGVQQVTLLDGQFNKLATYGINMLSIATEMLFSRDGSKVYVFAGTDEGSTTVVLSVSRIRVLSPTITGISGGSSHRGLREPTVGRCAKL